MNVTDELIREALDLAADHRPTSQTDWDQFERRTHDHASPSRGRRQWTLPALAGAAAAAVAVTAVLVGAQFASPSPVSPAAGHLTVVSSPAPAFPCTRAGALTDVAARIPHVTELGKPIDVGLRGTTFCASFAEGSIETPLASSGALRAFNATGGVNNVTIGVVDSTVTAIAFTPAQPGQPSTSVSTVVDLGDGLYGFYVPVHEDGTVTVQVGHATVAATSVLAIHGDPDMYGAGTAGPSPSAVPSPAPAPTTVTCAPADPLDIATTVPVTAPEGVTELGTAVIGYQHSDVQCLRITENGKNLTGRTTMAPARVLQYAGHVAGAHGSYQFVSATGVATSIRITRANGATTTLVGNDFTNLPTGFDAAVIYTPAGDPQIVSATAYDTNGRELNTTHMP